MLYQLIVMQNHDAKFGFKLVYPEYVREIAAERNMFHTVESVSMWSYKSVNSLNEDIKG